MQANRILGIAKANHRKATIWQNTDISWLDFVETLKSPVRTQEKYDEFLKLKKSEQDELKDVGGFTGAKLLDGRRKATNILSRDVVCLDLDNIQPNMTDDILKRVGALGCTAVVYSTRKHSNYTPRLRVLIPLDESCTPDEYEPIARKLGSLLGIENCDPTTFEVNRFMYYPSCSSDSEYIYQFYPGQFCSRKGVLNMYADWTDITTWPHVPGQDTRQKQLLARQQDPLTKNGLVGAFCKVYDITSAIQAFIPGLYEATSSPDRYTFTGGTTSGGAVLYDNKFLYSHHATDPCSGQLVNAFDLIRIHKFSNLDEHVKEGTPVSKYPSYSAMKKLALADDKVAALLNSELISNAKDVFDVVGDDDNQNDDELDWLSKLERNEEGRIQKTINNIVLILENDPNLKDKIAIDIFSNRGLVFGKLPWDRHYDASKEHRDWSEVDDASFARYLESVYKITGQDKQDKALLIVSDGNRINYVERYLTNLKWDGVPRVDTLLIDYFGAEDNAFTREAIRKSLVAAVARAIVGGVKFDVMTILAGPQGVGKSTFFSILGKDWFNDSLQTFEGKEASELIQGSWIVEVGELTAMNRHDTNAIKQFLSKREDIYREAYGRRTSKYPRRCVFYGTSNDDEFLKDPTGNRRFWPIDICLGEIKKSVWDDLPNEVDQVWAEAYTLFVMGESLQLSKEAEELANMAREQHREVNMREGLIKEFLDRPILPDWYSLDKNKRISFLSGTYTADDSQLVFRNKVCAAEIYEECLRGDIKYMKRQEAKEINQIISNIVGWVKEEKTSRFGVYGPQKGFRRV